MAVGFATLLSHGIAHADEMSTGCSGGFNNILNDYGCTVNDHRICAAHLRTFKFCQEPFHDASCHEGLGWRNTNAQTNQSFVSSSVLLHRLA
ncbi:hypothetical protein EJ03DRAFT_331483 [Teratosphaeria nubilosa]|uniref:Uncharacterized protein n=1 Tax=Teratosphaeria nubilosa TaxID=161662 RepID=A0A6G1KVY7_9PEZI|nr:hypothetical protein EJ03DRAFT_331483 [Teratosphaeria nubilosa]